MKILIKTTLTILLKESTIKKHKRGIKNILLYFRDVDTLDTNSINWQIRYDRNNQDYRMIIGICNLTLKGLLQSEKKGEKKLMEFLDNQLMNRLYEKFILNYYRKEHKYLKAYSPQIEWQLDDDFSEMLPRMQTDITLEYEDKILIIDAKYYGHTTQEQYGVHTLHSGNLYQVFTYVKNKDAEFGNEPHTVSGMLLYAQTDEIVQPNHVYHMSGNKISVRTLDLNCDFVEIAYQLNQIAEEYFSAK